MFTRIKPLGWAFLEVLTSSDITALDAQMPHAIDSRGGSYSIGTLELLIGTLRVDNLWRGNNWPAWPSLSYLENIDYEALGALPLLSVFVLDAMGTTHNVVLTRTNAIHGNLQLFTKRTSGAFGVVIFDTNTSTQVAIVGNKGWALTQYDSGNGYQLLISGTNP